MDRYKNHMFTEAEKEFLREFVPGHSHKEITAEFCRRFPPGVDESRIKSAIKRYHLNTGRTGRFQKGQEARNKGVPMNDEQYRMAAPTMFKKGNVPHNIMPIGTEIELHDGYIWVKINDIPKAKKEVNWRQKHRLLWEQNFGEIPEGYLVIFKDGNRRNFNIDNLACISKQVNLQMSRQGLRFTDADLTESGIALAEVMTAIYEKKGRKKHERSRRSDKSLQEGQGLDDETARTKGRDERLNDM